MKKILLLNLSLGIAFFAFSQNYVTKVNSLENEAVKRPIHNFTFDESIDLKTNENPYVSSKSGGKSINETVIGGTKYDLQTNRALQNRIYLYDDGTIGAAWTFSDDNSFSDRGTGYNYYDGSAWGSLPTQRIENGKCGWPSYAPLGTNGEIIASHYGMSGLTISTRAAKGTGSWNQTTYTGPSGHESIIFPRLVTSGDTIHLLAITLLTSLGGTLYNGQDGALTLFKVNRCGCDMGHKQCCNNRNGSSRL